MIPNKKGQALVEFVLILPVFIMLILGIIDLGRIIYTKNSLSNMTSDSVKLYENKKNYDEILKVLKENDKNIKLDIYKKDSLIYIKVSKNVDILTPGLNIIFKNPYQVVVSRVIPNENK